MTTHGRRARCVLAAFIVASALVAAKPAAAAPLLTEGFDNVGTLSGSGWTFINNSAPGGLVPAWFQGQGGIFPAFSGGADSYIASSFNSAGSGGALDNWLLTPTLSAGAGETLELSFWTRSNGAFPDRLGVYFSSNGGSSNTADFSLLPPLINGGLTADGYPDSWTKFTFSVSAASALSGRFGFHYFTPNTDVYSDYIGIDSVSVDAAAPVPEPASLTLLGLGLAGLAAQRRRAANRAHAQKGA
jgi:hypothetical protein